MGRVMANDVKDYIARFPPGVRAVLQRVRRTIRTAAPQAQEVISYGIPGYKQQGIVVYFATFKRHIGLYPPVRGDERLMRAVCAIRGSQGQFEVRAG